MIDSKINVKIEMKNLIIFFFVGLAYTASAQSVNEEVFAENIKTTERVKKVEKKIEKKAISVLSVKSTILEAFSKGDAKLLAASFGSNVDISILGKSNLYSKSQGEQVLNTFFNKNKVNSFTISHEGSSNGTKYFIGSYVSGTSKYRVTVNIKSSAGTNQIMRISIEN